MHSIFNIVGFSLLSAIGALPFLILPAITGSLLISNLQPINVLSTIGIGLSVGAFISCAISPIIFGNNITSKIALKFSFLLSIIIFIAPISNSFSSIILWIAIGFIGGILQYYGITMGVKNSTPLISSQVRLAISLLVSGLFIVASAEVVTFGYHALNYGLFLVIVILTLLSGLMFSKIDFSETKITNSPPLIYLEKYIFFKLYLIVFIFFAVFLPFISILPALITTQAIDTTLNQLGTAKILAMPFLIIFSLFYKYIPSHLYQSICILLLGIGCAASITTPTILSFGTLEVGINTCAAQLLSRSANQMSSTQKNWLPLAIESGAAFGFLVLRLL